MQALRLEAEGLEGFRLVELPTPRPGPGQVLVRLRAAALNHRDLWSCRGFKVGQKPFVPGSDGAGTIAAVGPGVSGLAEGTEVLVVPSLNWPEAVEAPGPDFEILGGPTDGTFAEAVLLPAENVVPKPEYLSWEEAAALPLSMLTAWRALFTRGALREGQSVVVTGIGGGTALACLKLAKAAGATVFVTSRDDKKRERALAEGADEGFDTAGPWAEEVLRVTAARGVDLVVETVGTPTWAQSFAALACGGKIVIYGSTGGDEVALNLVPLFLGWRSVLGTTMGSTAEFLAMLNFVARHRIKPVIDRVFPFGEAKEALTHLDWGAQFGKVVLCFPD